MLNERIEDTLFSHSSEKFCYYTFTYHTTINKAFLLTGPIKICTKLKRLIVIMYATKLIAFAQITY